jgi:hypothetical protein
MIIVYYNGVKVVAAHDLKRLISTTVPEGTPGVVLSYSGTLKRTYTVAFENKQTMSGLPLNALRLA